MDLNRIVEKIVNGTITEEELTKITRGKFLLNEYNGKSIIDYILYYKRNTIGFDKYSVYNAQIAKKYLEYGLKPRIDDEKILLSKYDDGKTIFEKYVEQNLSGAPISGTISNLLAAGKSLKEILMHKLARGKYIFEVLEEQQLNLDINYIVVANDKDTLLHLIENGYSKITSYIYDTDLLEERTNNGNNVFYTSLNDIGFDYGFDAMEISIKNGFFDVISSQYIKKIGEKKPFWFYEYYFFYFDKYVSNSGEYLNSLLIPASANLTYLDLFLMSKLDISKINKLVKNEPRLIPFYVKHGKWRELANESYEVWDTEVDGKKVVEYLIDYIKTDFKCSWRESFLQNVTTMSKNNVRIAEILYNNGLLYCCLSCEEFLLSQATSNSEIYLESIIQKFKLYNSFSRLKFIQYTEKLLTYRSATLNNQMLIEFLIDNGYFDMDRVTEDLLLVKIDGEKTMLEFLIQKKRTLVEKWQKNRQYIYNPQIKYILANNGIFDSKHIISLSEFDTMKKSYLRDLFLNKHDIKIDEYDQTMLNYFRELMLSDGKSDEEVVNLACASIRQQLADDVYGNRYALRDLNNLIQIKQTHPDFSLKKTQNRAYFNSQDWSVYVTNVYDISTLNHELGHLMHYWSRKFEMPFGFERILNQIDISRVIAILEPYLFKFNQSIRFSSEQLKNSLSNVDVRSSYEQLKNKVFGSGMGQEVCQYISSNLLLGDEFDSVFKQVCLNELNANVNTILNEGNAFNAVTDIMDALCCGRLFDFAAKNNLQLSGHGSNYYQNANISFQEIIADYAAIIKSPKREELLGMLTQLVGPEFVQFLEEYYSNFTYEAVRLYDPATGYLL